MFAIITPALITGAFADRVNFKSYLIFLVAWSFLIYIPLAHWIWGGGFLQQLGVVDFAGGIVVHTSAGLAALASILFVGRNLSDDQREPVILPLRCIGNRIALVWMVRIQRRRCGKFRSGRCICQYGYCSIRCNDNLAGYFMDQRKSQALSEL